MDINKTPEDTKINDWPPKRVYEQFKDHKLCKNKCNLEKEALNICNNMHKI